MQTPQYDHSRFGSQLPARFSGSRGQRYWCAALLCVGLLTVAGRAGAQDTPASGYQPMVGQEGKDVVWVPTPQTLVEEMLNIAQVQAGEFLIDLGSGDGRTVIAAAKRGLRALGIEYNPEMVELARRNARQARVDKLASFQTGDLFEADLSQAQIITLFLLPSINEQLKPRLLELAPGTRIVSNSFTMGDWEADQSAVVTEECNSYCTALLWRVPAKVAGVWRLGSDTLTLSQQYQMLSGTLGQAELSEARMDGTTISFTAAGVRYTGTVTQGQMSGRREGGADGTWTAVKL